MNEDINLTLKEAVEKELIQYDVHKHGNHPDLIAPSHEEITIYRIFKLIQDKIDERIQRYKDKDTFYSSLLQRIAGLEEAKDVLK